MSDAATGFEYSGPGFPHRLKWGFAETPQLLSLNCVFLWAGHKSDVYVWGQSTTELRGAQFQGTAVHDSNSFITLKREGGGVVIQSLAQPRFTGFRQFWGQAWPRCTCFPHIKQPCVIYHHGWVLNTEREQILYSDLYLPPDSNMNVGCDTIIHMGQKQKKSLHKHYHMGISTHQTFLFNAMREILLQD